ncbi:hypothetical protein ACU8MB_00890 [Rhizobium leguminosarum]
MDTNLIDKRRSEIEAEMKDLNERLTALKLEMGELDIAARVIGRLSGTEISKQVRGEDRSGTALTVRQMIKAALREARQRGLPGMRPNNIRAFVKKTYGLDIGQQINTTASRMWRDLREIEKDEPSGLFYLPKEKPVDDASLETPSTGSDGNPEPGHEGGRGGDAT